MNFLWAMGASIAVSLISLIGIFSLLLGEKLLDKILILLVGFSAGSLIGSAFFHLLPETLEKFKDPTSPFIYAVAGFMVFFVLERYFHWRHCHDGKCDVHAFTYLNLIGDGTHNFIDGLIIGAGFFTSVNVGLIAAFAIIFHEIPQEMGDFGVLLYGGFTKAKALFFNFLSALTAILGTIIGYYFSDRITNFSGILLAIAAGGFIYIAACDLIPELHRQIGLKKTALSILFFLLGILIMLALKLVHHH